MTLRGLVCVWKILRIFYGSFVLANFWLNLPQRHKAGETLTAILGHDNDTEKLCKLLIKMTDIITIREYETKDKNEVINLIKLNTPKYFAVDEEEDLNKYLETERELYYVLLYDKKIVGCGGINFSDDNTTGKISWDILHPDYQGKSLGTRLLKHRIDKLNSIDGIQKITVRTSQVAYKFYEKQGFELFEIKKNYWAEGFDMYNMEYKRQ